MQTSCDQSLNLRLEMIQFLANPAFLLWLQRTESLKLLSNPGLQLPPLFPYLGGTRQYLEFRGKCVQRLIEQTHQFLLWACQCFLTLSRFLTIFTIGIRR